jgi:hypothetical protein
VHHVGFTVLINGKIFSQCDKIVTPGKY